MTVLAVVPARGGSKGVPGKNIRLLGGRPLIAYSIETALKADGIDRVVVSTDDPKTRDIALELGAEAPFLRPQDLSGDTVSDTPVLAHATAWYAENEGLPVDTVALFRPTTPFRKLRLVEMCLARLRDTNADSVRPRIYLWKHAGPACVTELAVELGCTRSYACTELHH